MAYKQCCRRPCADVYLVSETGEIVWRRNFYIDSPTSSFFPSVINGIGRGDNGHVSASVHNPNQKVVVNPSTPQDEPMYIVRQWDGETGELRWSWSDAPDGWIIPNDGSPQRSSPVAFSSAVDRTGRTIVCTWEDLGQNITGPPPNWFGNSRRDWAHALDEGGNVLWSLTAREMFGYPQTLWSPDWAWDGNIAARIVAAGTNRSLWGTTEKVGHKLWWMVDNADGTVIWAIDDRPWHQTVNFSGTSINPGNAHLWLGYGVLGGNDEQNFVMGMGADDRLLVAFQDGLFDIDYDTALLGAWTEASAPPMAFEGGARLQKIRVPTSILVSPDCSRIVVLGYDERLLSPDRGSWIEVYDSSFALIHVFDAQTLLGNTPPAGWYVFDDGTLAAGGAIFQDVAGTFTPWRHWVSASISAAAVDADGMSVWGGGVACPAYLVPDA